MHRRRRASPSLGTLHPLRPLWTAIHHISFLQATFTFLATTATVETSCIQVISAGTLVPQSTLLELKTRSLQSSFDRVEAYPQLFFSKTP